MTLYDMIKQNGAGKGEDIMWRSIERISDFLEDNEIDTEPLIRDLYADIVGCHYNRDFADEEIKKMFYIDKQGTKVYAPYWSDETMHSVWNNVQNLIPNSYNENDFKVVLNMLKADYGTLFEKWFGSDADKHIIDMSVAYLNDPDCEHKNSKVWHQLND